MEAVVTATRKEERLRTSPPVAFTVPNCSGRESFERWKAFRRMMSSVCRPAPSSLKTREKAAKGFKRSRKGSKRL